MTVYSKVGDWTFSSKHPFNRRVFSKTFRKVGGGGDLSLPANSIPCPHNKQGTRRPTVLASSLCFQNRPVSPGVIHHSGGSFHFWFVFIAASGEQGCLGLLAKFTQMCPDVQLSHFIRLSLGFLKWCEKLEFPLTYLKSWLICWHSPSCPGGNCFVQKGCCVRGAGATTGNTLEALWSLKRVFAWFFKQSCSEKKSTSIPPCPHGFSAPPTWLRGILSHAKLWGQRKTSSTACYCGGGRGVSVCGPLYQAAGFNRGKHESLRINLTQLCLKADAVKCMNAHTHTHALCRFLIESKM